MNLYIQFEKAGDFFVGRSFCGRERHEQAFVESITYFDFSSDPNANTNKTVLDNWIRSRMPEEGHYSDNIILFFKACLASLAFHRQYLEETGHQRSPLRASMFWSERIPLANHAITTYPWNKTKDKPSNLTNLLALLLQQLSSNIN
jgi:hypothetical protein